MSRLIAVVGLAILVLAGASAVNAAFQASGQGYHVDDESFSPDPGVNQLTNSNIANATYNNSITVSVSGDTVDSDGNYSWLQHNGTIDVESGSYLANQTSANASYGWVENSDQERNFVSLFASGFDVAQLLVLVMTAGLVLLTVRALGGV